MNKKNNAYTPDMLPTTKQLESELKRVTYQRNYRIVLRSTIYTLITVAAAAILVAVLLLPVLRIYGSSMDPTLKEEDIVPFTESIFANKQRLLVASPVPFTKEMAMEIYRQRL